MNRWQDKELGEILNLQYGKGLPKRKRVEGTYPVFGSGGIVDYHSDFLVQGPGIIVGRKGSIGTVYFSKESYWPIDTVYYVDLDAQQYDLKFVYYMLSSMGLDRLDSDAAVPGLNRSIAHSQKCSIPPLPIQRRIAAILSAYDDLIENNTRRIAILEEMAQMLYREWFVHFRFPGHENVEMVDSELGAIPEGWKVNELGDVMELAYGKGLRKKDRVPGPYPVYGSSGIIDSHNEPIVEGPGIIVGRKGNVGSVYWSDEGFCPIDTVFYVKTDLNLRYVYYNLQHQNFIGTHTAVPGLNRNQAYLLPFLVPDEGVLDKFEEIVEVVLAQKRNLESKNEILRRARDLLLPRLVSGELDVSDLDIVIGETLAEP